MPLTKDSAKHSNIYDLELNVTEAELAAGRLELDGVNIPRFIIGEPLPPASEPTEEAFRRLEQWIIEYHHKERDKYMYPDGSPVPVGVPAWSDEETQIPWTKYMVLKELDLVLKELNTGDISRLT